MVHDLSAVGAGFSNEAFGSQAVFRSALQALSHPGRLVAVAHDAERPQPGHAASAVLLLAMLDADCSLWLSPTLRAGNAGTWLRFHTGCQLVDAVEDAQFVWVGAADPLPPLRSLRQGSDEYPDQSATCVLDVRTLADGEGAGDDGMPLLTLSGPGIQTRASLRVVGLPDDFGAQWVHNHAGFPRGVDLFLATDEALVGLPRTTRIQTPVEA